MRIESSVPTSKDLLEVGYMHLLALEGPNQILSIMSNRLHGDGKEDENMRKSSKTSPGYTESNVETYKNYDQVVELM